MFKEKNSYLNLEGTDLDRLLPRLIFLNMTLHFAECCFSETRPPLTRQLAGLAWAFETAASAIESATSLAELEWLIKWSCNDSVSSELITVFRFGDDDNSKLLTIVAEVVNGLACKLVRLLLVGATADVATVSFVGSPQDATHLFVIILWPLLDDDNVVEDADALADDLIELSFEHALFAVDIAGFWVWLVLKRENKFNKSG